MTAIRKWLITYSWSRQRSPKVEAFNDSHWSKFRQQQQSWVPI